MQPMPPSPPLRCSPRPGGTRNLTGARRAHGEHADGAAWILLLEVQGLFKGIQVFGVEDGGQGGAVDGAFWRHGVFAHISSIGHLLGKHHDFQCFCHKIKNLVFNRAAKIQLFSLTAKSWRKQLIFMGL